MKSSRQSSKSPSRKVGYLIVVIAIVGIVGIGIYVSSFKNQGIDIVNLLIDSKTILSGDSLNISAYLRKSVPSYMGDILNLLYDHDEELEIKIDEKTVLIDKYNVKYNENMTRVYSLLEKEPGRHKICVGNLSEEFEVLKTARFEGDYLRIIPEMPLVGEDVNVSLDVRNIGGIEDSQIFTYYLNNIEVGNSYVSLHSNASTDVGFSLNNMTLGVFDISVVWETGDANETFDICSPSNPLDRRIYYYGQAERYVSTEYQLPENKDITSLVFFLDQIEFPKYAKDVFDCADSSSLLEWLMEGAGFQAYICSNTDHAWVQVETSDGIVAIESVELTSGWGLHGYDIKPTGIKSKEDGTFEEFTYHYSIFLEWKRKYPSPPYDYDPKITFEEWNRDWSKPVFQPFGIPSSAGYYTESRKDHPPSGWVDWDNRGWWDSEPYSTTFPFSFW